MNKNKMKMLKQQDQTIAHLKSYPAHTQSNLFSTSFLSKCQCMCENKTKYNFVIGNHSKVIEI